MFGEMFNRLNLMHCYSNKLVVTLSKAAPQLEAITEAPAQRQNGMELTQEQIDMLNEEPEMMTTNALRAVYGYDPKDDRRLCPHYDPKTGGCWKGNTCKFEHGPKLEGEQVLVVRIFEYGN